MSGVAVRHYQPRRWTGGPPVVLLHGGKGAHWVWDRHAAFLAGRGHDVHVPDWYGLGVRSSVVRVWWWFGCCRGCGLGWGSRGGVREPGTAQGLVDI